MVAKINGSHITSSSQKPQTYVPINGNLQVLHHWQLGTGKGWPVLRVFHLVSVCHGTTIPTKKEPEAAVQ